MDYHQHILSPAMSGTTADEECGTEGRDGQLAEERREVEEGETDNQIKMERGE